MRRSRHQHHAASVPQDVLRDAATVLRECSSNDIFTLASFTLEAAIRNEDDMIQLLNEAKPLHLSKATAVAATHA
jgi:hypothetical protein